MSANRHLDPHCRAILQEYEDNLPRFREVEAQVRDTLRRTLQDAGLAVAAIESRVKGYDSLAGKLELKGHKYKSLANLTDILGLRVITFYIDDVDKVASAVERLFTIDWENSVDKRKIHEIDSFGYLSLHYICSIPDFPYRFEIQMRTLLQHAWANMDHDTGYKSGVEIPRRYLRNMSRLAGMLELVDDEFSKIRIELTDYRRRIQSLVASGKLDEVPLDEASFRSFISMKPFDQLNQRIAATNQAEIYPVSQMPFLPVLEYFHFDTLGEVQRFIETYSDAAFQLALSQLALTDLDILSENVGLQNLCIVYALKMGLGRDGVLFILNVLNGEDSSNEMMADMFIEQASNLSFMQS